MNFLREIVSGPKNRMKEDGYNLDLTYVCPRVIAMSYPASGVESVYRNPIDKVTKFIKSKHQNNFLVFNLSGRMYNYAKFEDQVLDFQWEDHHSPPIHTLFLICQKMQMFLKAKKENVCIIHCLAGKGRTGTIICCFLIYSGIIDTTEDALNYYSKKRFIQEGFGVNQPCQIRYLDYFHEILKYRETSPIYPKLVYIKKIVFYGRPNFNTQKGCRPYFDIVYVRTKQLIFSTKKAYSEAPKFLEGDSYEFEFEQQVALCGDLLIRIKHNGYYKNQKIARISLNTSFVPDDNVNKANRILRFKLEELSPSNLLKDSRFPKTFTIEIHFGQFCNCTRFTSFKDKCKICSPQIQKEKEYWEIMHRILKNYYPLDKQEQRNLLFGNPNSDDIQQVLQNKSVEKQYQNNTFKFDSQQDKFIQESDVQKKENGKMNSEIEEVKENCSPTKQLDKNFQFDQCNNGDDEIVSPIKIRKRSDVRHNFYSEDQAFSSKKIQGNQIRINTSSNSANNKENVANQNELEIDNQQGNNEDNDDYDNDEINDIPEGPPSPLSPKNSYANKNENDTDIDSPYEDSHPNLPKNSQNFSQFSKGYKQTSNLLLFDKDSFDDLHNDSDDPAPQKPFQGDKIFVNNMKHQ
ncbi:hypothetical protein ABPG74_009244 [Tetrahymena malaccensis]